MPSSSDWKNKKPPLFIVSLKAGARGCFVAVKCLATARLGTVFFSPCSWVRESKKDRVSFPLLSFLEGSRSGMCLGVLCVLENRLVTATCLVLVQCMSSLASVRFVFFIAAVWGKWCKVASSCERFIGSSEGIIYLVWLCSMHIFLKMYQ
jgi:hypothetical protein